MNYIYPDILLICCDIIFSCVVSGWVLPVGFFYPGGCGYGTKCIPTCGCGWWVRFYDMGAGLVMLYPHPMGAGAIGRLLFKGRGKTCCNLGWPLVGLDWQAETLV
jgi:hypothetical protein